MVLLELRIPSTRSILFSYEPTVYFSEPCRRSEIGHPMTSCKKNINWKAVGRSVGHQKLVIASDFSCILLKDNVH